MILNYAKNLARDIMKYGKIIGISANVSFVLTGAAIVRQYVFQAKNMEEERNKLIRNENIPYYHIKHENGTYHIIESTEPEFGTQLLSSKKCNPEDKCAPNCPNAQEQDVSALRSPYRVPTDVFRTADIPIKDPINQFSRWMHETLSNKDIPEPNAMCIATATKNGEPSARFMLLKAYGNEGFRFFSNYESKKAEDLEENPVCAACVYWYKLNRQIRIQGTVRKMSKEESAEYFKRRPRDNQIGTWSSYQSRPVATRTDLIDAERALEEQYKGQEVPCPHFWGGYILVPYSVEFWQGQNNRIHDRIRFRKSEKDDEVDNHFVFKGENGWVYERLGP